MAWPRVLITVLICASCGLAPDLRAQLISVANSGASAPVTFLKGLSLEELLKMDITSVSRRPEPFSTAASAVSVLTGDDVRRSGATTLADALRYSTGLQVARIDGRTWGIAARGFNVNASNKLLVMIDGRSVYTPLFSGVFWDVQDTELADLDRIEIVRGPGATMWGANAVNGVISIQTKPARETLGTHMSAGGGTEERTFASFRHGLRLAESIYGRVYVKQVERDDLLLANGTDANDDTRMWQGGFRIDGEKSAAANSWTAQGDIYHGFLGITVGPDSRVAGGNLVWRGEHAFSPDRALQLQAGYDRVERFVVGQFREWRDSFDVDLQFNTPVDLQQQLVSGLTARTSTDRTGTSGTIRFVPARRRMTVLGGFVQDEIRSRDERLSVMLGAKFEHNDSTGTEFQPSVRVAWRTGQQQTIWAAVSRAVRTPSRFDDDLRFVVPTVGTLISGSWSFRSEELLAGELGYRIHSEQGWAADVTLFSNRYDRLRSQERATEPGVFFVLQNQLNARTSGGEIALTVEPHDGWRLRAMYAYLHKELWLDPGSTDLTRGTQEGNDPKHHWTLVSNLTLPAHWEFDLLLRRVSSLPLPFVPAYMELDAHLGWQPFPAWELALVGQNLLHPRHAEYSGGRLVERSAYAKVTWRF